MTRAAASVVWTTHFFVLAIVNAGCCALNAAAGGPLHATLAVLSGGLFVAFMWHCRDALLRG